MPKATMRASARTLPEATNRRAVLGAVLAAGAAGAMAVLPVAASGMPTLSAVDRRVIDLWDRRARLQVGIDRLLKQINTAEAQMPKWAQAGPKYVLAKGELFIPGVDDVRQVFGWPEVADLDQQPVDVLGLIIARPSTDDLVRQFFSDQKADYHEAARRLTRALVAQQERLKEQEVERQRTNFNELNERLDEVCISRGDIGLEIQRHAESSILALGATFLITIELDDDEDDVLQTYRASLRAIRPQLVGAIAEDADRVLAQGEESV
jgi:hypothetical protein